MQNKHQLADRPCLKGFKSLADYQRNGQWKVINTYAVKKKKQLRLYVQTNANEVVEVMVMSASPNHLAPHANEDHKYSPVISVL